MKRTVDVVIERGENGYYIASVPALPGCHTQAKTLDELNKRIKEAIKLYLEVDKEAAKHINGEFIGIQKVEISA